MKLYCTQSQFETLHAQLDLGRQSNPAVKVDREALRNLLMDHSNLLKPTDRTSEGFDAFRQQGGDFGQ